MKKMIPPTLFMICIATMLGLWWLVPMMQFLPFPVRAMGLLPLLAGIGLAKYGSDFFLKKETTIETFDDPHVLVIDGPYQISRNPMYLGFLVALLGLFIVLGCLSPLLGVIIFFIITDRWYIEYEEAAMTKVFGDAYTEYTVRTRRWL